MDKVVWNFIIHFSMVCLSSWVLKEYLETLYEKKINWTGKARWIFFVLWQVISVLVLKWPDYIVLTMSILAVLLVSLNYEGHIIKKIVFTIVYNSIWMLIEIILVFIFVAMGLDYAAQGLLGSLLSKVMLLILVEALRRFFGNVNIKELPHFYSVFLILIPLGSMFVVYTSFLMSADTQRPLSIFWSFVSLAIMFLINVLIFTIYKKVSEAFELRQKNVVYKQELDLYSKYMEEKENTMLDFRKARHDLKNQLIFLLECCEKKEYKALTQYLEQLIEKAPFDSILVAKTDNSVVDAIVNYKYSIAKRFGIEITVKLNIPIQLPFENTDMCVILGNALDNAIEANIRSKCENRYIKLNMRMDNHNLMIIIENSFDGYVNKDKKGKLLTVKRDKLDHGLGLDSIQNAIEKYHGYMHTFCNEKVFILEILIYGEWK